MRAATTIRITGKPSHKFADRKGLVFAGIREVYEATPSGGRISDTSILVFMATKPIRCLVDSLLKIDLLIF